jgi:hypothetical protein
LRITASRISMHAEDRPGKAFETVDEAFHHSFSFAAEDGLRKTVTVSRSGRKVCVKTVYIDGAVTDAAIETFEADGAVRISIVESGLYIAGHRSLPAERVRLQRRRFF